MVCPHTACRGEDRRGEWFIEALEVRAGGAAVSFTALDETCREVDVQKQCTGYVCGFLLCGARDTLWFWLEAII
ncbi:hypothetical protein BaRGS_00033965 [Batillaria attramentaria]|uniref:Uncharacterized protein n=1 Tax=Batillaria attramentaria TaxID=370345 RepID=A0ABD0JIM4_9CAEN